MIEAVLFDLDGTLVCYAESYADFLRDLASRWGITDAQDPFHLAYAEAVRADGAVTFRSSVEAALEASGWPAPDGCDAQCQAVVAEYAKGIRMLPGAVELLDRYPGLPKAIVSNGPGDMQRAAIGASGLGRHFNHILISGDADVAVRKPNPAIFRLACERLGALPARTLMIGDNFEVDVEGARAAGLQAISISQPPKPDAGPSCFLPHPDHDR